MNKYYVYTRETACYCYVVEAESEKDASDKVFNGEYYGCDFVDSYNFEVTEVELTEENIDA